MITAWILLSPVLADTGSGGAMQDVACLEPSLNAHRPVDGQVDVPIDAAMMLAYTTDGCIQDVWVTVESETEVLFDERIELEVGDPITLIGDLPFEPEETYTLVTTTAGDTAESGQQFTFTTGVDTAVIATTPPVVSLYEVNGTEKSSEVASWDSEFHVSADPVPSGLSYVEIIDSRNSSVQVATAFVPGTGELELAARWTALPTEEEICLQARQIDGAGIPGDWSAPDCLIPTVEDSTVDWPDVTESCSGCASSRGTPASWALLLPLLGLLRRKRS